MASSGYGVETTVESIWSKAWDTTQFDFVNVTIGTEFNFYITGDGNTDITNTKVTSMLKETTHKLFGYWNALIKTNNVHDPWGWIQIWLAEADFSVRYRNLIKNAQDILYPSIEMVTRTLPTTTDSNVIP